MALHIFGNIVTQYGVASNNRGDNQGSNISPLQKIIWCGEPHTTVSAEAIRFAVRRGLAMLGLPCNRSWAEHDDDLPKKYLELFKKKKPKAPCNVWEDPDFKWYQDLHSSKFADDDLLGFMSADAGGQDASDEEQEGEPPIEPEAKDAGKKGKRAKTKGSSFVRRSVLEIARAVSINPWDGNVIFNCASVAASPDAGGSDPMPYNCEAHSTRYQYGTALTPERLRNKALAVSALKVLGSLGSVAGNQGRFKFDFSPDSIVLRITDDPAPRLLYCFDSKDDGKTVSAERLIQRVKDGDIEPRELLIGGSICHEESGRQLKDLGVSCGEKTGVVPAIAEACKRINEKLGIKE